MYEKYYFFLNERLGNDKITRLNFNFNIKLMKLYVNFKKQAFFHRLLDKTDLCHWHILVSSEVMIQCVKIDNS